MSVTEASFLLSPIHPHREPFLSFPTLASSSFACGRCTFALAASCLRFVDTFIAFRGLLIALRYHTWHPDKMRQTLSRAATATHGNSFSEAAQISSVLSLIEATARFNTPYTLTISDSGVQCRRWIS